MTFVNRQDVLDVVESYIHEIITESGVDKNAHTNAILRQIKSDIDDIPTSDNVLDEIRAEVEQAEFVLDKSPNLQDDRTDTEKFADWLKMFKMLVINIIDKYKE